MSLLTPRLTDDGKAMVVAALNGDSITFTKAVIGNTATAPAYPEQLTDVVSPMVTAAFTAITEGTNYVSLAAVFDNTEIETGAYASELGLFAEDSNGDEKLYAYTYVGENADYIPANDSGRTVENHMTIVVAIGDAENVDAVLVDAAAYATREEFEDHIHDYENPHQVTKEQVGLGLVENNYFVDNDIVVDQLTSAANVQTGDTLREAMSKIYYWIQKMISPGFIPTTGLGDTKNPTAEGISGDLWFTNSIRQNYPHGIGGYMSRNDVWRIVSRGDQAINPEIYSDYSDCGYLEIATGDNAHEPIIVRQYGGGTVNFETVVRTLYLLDYYGNTKIPGELKLYGGYRGVRWSNVEKPSATGGTSGDGAYVGLVPGTAHYDCLELGVADDGDEPVIVRQRTYGTNIGIDGTWTSLPIRRTAYLLNNAGNTVFPGSCTATSHPTSSDLKKKDVHGKVDLETAEKLIMGLDPILYNFKGDWKESAGFGAQDVYKLTHEIGLEDNGLYRATKMPGSEEIVEGVEYHDSDINAHDDSDIEWNLNYTEFIPYLVKVIQDQQVRLVEQEERIDALEEKLEEVTTCLQ